LPDWVEDSVGVRVCSGASNPLPSELVAGYVTIDKVFHEVLCSKPPVEVEILYKKGRCHHSKAIVHKTFGGQLSHPSVDERITRKAF
jgi:hypothetical protein